MIPAILSCLFVLYLYQTLNTTDHNQDSNSPTEIDLDDSAASVSDRLAGLRARIDRIALSFDDREHDS